MDEQVEDHGGRGMAFRRGSFHRHQKSPFVRVRLGVVQLTNPGLSYEYGSDWVPPAAGVMVVNEALKFLLFSVAEDPGLLLRIAQRGVIEWFTGLQAAAPDRELYRCEAASSLRRTHGRRGRRPSAEGARGAGGVFERGMNECRKACEIHEGSSGWDAD